MPRHQRQISTSQNVYAQSLPVTMGPTAQCTSTSESRIPLGDYLPQPTASGSGVSVPSRLQHQSYHSVGIPTIPHAVAVVPHRPSSGAWTLQDDQQLLRARQQGLNWNQIKDSYFPSKTGNACRKRHERLMDRKGGDSFDTRRMDLISKEYMSMRKEIWQGLAMRTNERWQDIEQKCMSSGLKNIQSHARAYARLERAESAAGFPSSGYDDDSGISGIGLTPVDDLDASYSSPETASTSSGAQSAASSNYANSYPNHPHAQQPHRHQQSRSQQSAYPSAHPPNSLSLAGSSTTMQLQSATVPSANYGMGPYQGSYSCSSSLPPATGTFAAPAPNMEPHHQHHNGNTYMHTNRHHSLNLDLGSVMSRSKGM